MVTETIGTTAVCCICWWAPQTLLVLAFRIIFPWTIYYIPSFSHGRQCGRSLSRNRFQHACILRPCTTTRRIDEKFSISSSRRAEKPNKHNIYNVLLWIPLHIYASLSCRLCDRGRLVPATSPCVFFSTHATTRSIQLALASERDPCISIRIYIYPHNNNNSSSMSWLPYLSLLYICPLW